MDDIEFKKTNIVEEETGLERSAVAVLRNNQQVALLPDANRADRALSLPLEEISYILEKFSSIMGREPTRDEREFWRAVLDFRRGE